MARTSFNAIRKMINKSCHQDLKCEWTISYSYGELINLQMNQNIYFPLIKVSVEVRKVYQGKGQGDEDSQAFTASNLRFRRTSTSISWQFLEKGRRNSSLVWTSENFTCSMHASSPTNSPSGWTTSSSINAKFRRGEKLQTYQHQTSKDNVLKKQARPEMLRANGANLYPRTKVRQRSSVSNKNDWENAAD